MIRDQNNAERRATFAQPRQSTAGPFLSNALHRHLHVRGERHSEHRVAHLMPERGLQALHGHRVRRICATV